MGMYDTFTFADYEFREFPMAVSMDEEGLPTKEPYGPKGKRREQIIVKSAAELKALVEGDAVIEDGKIRTEEDEKADLLTAAAQAGAKVDRRWSPERIRKAIDDHVSGEQPL
jgi:hypothetical protein